ncbi:MAG: hypothetical protein ACQ9MH_22695 [Nitrospinales bacterium]
MYQKSTSTMVQDNQGQSRSVLSVLVLSFLCLIFAHLAVKAFFPNPVFWVIGAVLLVITGAGWMLIRKDDFGFLLALFVCAHFNFADNQGGIWAYYLCAVLLIRIALGRHRSFILSSVPISANVLVLIFLLHQIIGTILNPYSLISNIQATVVALSQLLVFYYCASQKMDGFNLKRLLAVWFAIACWVFVMGLNQKYHWLITPSPLLPQRYYGDNILASVPAGAFQNSELFAEYFCIVFVLSLVIFSSNKEMAQLRIKKNLPILMILISIASIMMGASRAAVLLALAAAFYLTFLSFAIAPSRQNFQRLFSLITILSLSGILMLFLGSFFSLDKMAADFEDLNPSKINVETVISGKGINRSFTGAYQRLSRGSWWFGYGYNLPENNPKSLGTYSTIEKKGSDYHSLYVCLPFFYGWVGAAAYVLLLILTGFRIYMCYLKNRKLDHFLVPIALGFAVVWGVFLLDQYKISVTRNPVYFFLTWMLLGWTHALANGMSRDKLSTLGP